MLISLSLAVFVFFLNYDYYMGSALVWLIIYTNV